MAPTPTTSSVNFRNADKPAVVPLVGQRISGIVPDWLEGNLYRNGPGIHNVGPDEYKHLFDGLSLLHRFHIKNGKVEYQSRYLESETYKRNMAAQRIILHGFGTQRYEDPCKALLDQYKTEFAPKDDLKQDNCNVNVAFYGDQLYAMTETCFVRRVDPNTLETLGGRVRITDHVAVNHATAHPHVQPNGNILNLGNNYRHKRGPHYCIIQVPPTYESEETSFKDAKIVVEIPCSIPMKPSYFHSFGMTTDKTIFIEQPYCIDLPKMATSDVDGITLLSALAWNPNLKTRIHVACIRTGELHPIIYETDQLFTFHHVNAYEENGHIIMDVSGYNNADIVENITVDKILTVKGTVDGATLRRYILPLEVSQDTKPGVNLIKLKDIGTAHAELSSSGGPRTIIDVKPDHFTSYWHEFPRINYKYNGQKYNYIYGLTASPEKIAQETIPITDTIVKYDIANRKDSFWSRPDVLASEPVFISNPKKSSPAEDDGVLLSALLHLDDPKKVSLLILDSKNMKELALVEFATEGVVPTTFHGLWAHDGGKVQSF